MVTGQSGKVAAVVPQKLHSVVGYIVCFSNIRKISNLFICLSEFVSVLMHMRVKDHYGNTIVYTKLSEANPEVIKHPCRIYEVRKKIRIPRITWQMITTNNQVVVRGMGHSMQYYSDPIHTLTIDILCPR